MERNATRRGLLGALVGAAALSPVGELLDSFAPPSGRAWRGTGGPIPGEVTSPHGDATVTYDDYRVPHVEADDEAAAYFAVGYAQAADRLFEMDLIRRLMDGRLAAAVGERAVESDRFHAKMDFRGAAEASAETLAGSRVEADYRRLYAEPFDHGAPILREGIGGDLEGVGGAHGSRGSRRRVDRDPRFVDWLAAHEPPRSRGSNHWAVAGEHTDSGAPILAYDPHLTLLAPAWGALLRGVV